MTGRATQDEGGPLGGRTVLVIGATSGIARRIAADAAAAGAEVLLAGRDAAAAERAAAAAGGGVRAEHVDLADEGSIGALARRTGPVDHIATLASAPANGPLADLERDAVVRALDAKVVGPILLAKHFAGRFRPGGSLLLFSGIAAWRPAPERTVMATVNGAVSFLAAALALELAPVRVNALSPGIVDSGAWDALGTGKEALFRDTADHLPVGRIGTTADIASAALLAMTNPFVTGTTLHVDGGGRLV